MLTVVIYLKRYTTNVNFSCFSTINIVKLFLDDRNNPQVIVETLFLAIVLLSKVKAGLTLIILYLGKTQ